jgi:hypothetical protein
VWRSESAIVTRAATNLDFLIAALSSWWVFQSRTSRMPMILMAIQLVSQLRKPVNADFAKDNGHDGSGLPK